MPVAERNSITVLLPQNPSLILCNEMFLKTTSCLAKEETTEKKNKSVGSTFFNSKYSNAFHFPLNTGTRFSTKAAMPSFWSSDAKVR